MGLLARHRPLVQLQRGLLFQYGWLKSWWRRRPVDTAGKPLPWLTYPAIDFISQFDFSDASVFEWGSGYSTLWWAERCRRIVTVESNVKWVAYIKPLLPTAVEFIVSSFDVEAEVAALTGLTERHFDVFVIDNHGPFRWRCAEVAASSRFHRLCTRQRLRPHDQHFLSRGLSLQGARDATASKPRAAKSSMAWLLITPPNSSRL